MTTFFALFNNQVKVVSSIIDLFRDADESELITNLTDILDRYRAKVSSKSRLHLTQRYTMTEKYENRVTIFPLLKCSVLTTLSIP